MQPKRVSIELIATVAICAGTLFATSTFFREKILYGFASYSGDGAYPRAGLVVDPAGNLFGTTNLGGAYNDGTVFELIRKAGGKWTEKILYSFSDGADGAFPTAGVILDTAGNLYGTTNAGGSNAQGTVFELTPKAGGVWTEKVLHSFGNGKDGEGPYVGLVFDGHGNLYGTTYAGGADGLGTVFELTPEAGGKWAEKVLHSFGHGTDGASPYAGLITDAAGDLYGTTYGGGAGGLGTVFELTSSGAKWAEKVLHSFSGADGEHAVAGLVFDHAGNLYGATETTIFELTRKAGGGWTERVLNNSGTENNLIFGDGGNLYGTTYLGGLHDEGTVFELAHKAGGKWMYLSLYDFLGGVDGANPLAGLALDRSGNMYGTTYLGGLHDEGTVFEMAHSVRGMMKNQ
jgi:uncharacterized repeat protein (TIGR03803 family)